MAYLARAKKIDLLTLVEELGLEGPESPKCAQIVEVITGSGTYDEEFTKNLLARITSEREESETRVRDEAEREHELKRIQTQNRGNMLANPKFNINKIMTKYESPGDIGIYLNLFERQITRLELGREEWVNQLLLLLPLNIVQYISREPDPVASDYEQVKRLLLKKYRLSTEQFRQKFVTHRKETTSTWRDFAFEISSYLDEWMNGMEVGTLDDFKELIIVDNMRRKIPDEVRDHFCDELPKIKKVEELVNKLDEYEAVRSDLKRNENKFSKEIKRRPFRSDGGNKSFVRNDIGRWQFKDNNNTIKRENVDKKIRCFRCNSAFHKIYDCPQKREESAYFRNKKIDEKSENSSQSIAKRVNTTEGQKYDSPDKIMKNIEVQGQEFDALIDTGADVNMSSYESYIKLGRPKLQKSDLTLSGISGNQIVPVGFINANIKMDGYAVKSKLYVVRGLDYEVIVGTSFLRNLNFNISEKGLNILSEREVGDAKVNYVTISNRIAEKAKPSQNTCVSRIAGGAEEDLRLGSRCTSVNNESNECANCVGKESNECADCVRKKSRNQDKGYETMKVLIKDKLEYSRDRKISKIEELNSAKLVSVLLAETAESINVNELEINHIVNKRVKKELMRLIDNYRPNKVKDTELKVKIILKDDIPIAQRPRRLAFAEQEFVDKQINEWLEKGIIKESSSNYSSPIVLAKKKDNSFRLCVDYRSLNKKIIKDNFPLPIIEEVLDSIEQAKIFTTLDLKNAFFHINIEEGSKKYTSFVTHNNQFEFEKLPFGLSLGSQSFQRYIQAVFKTLIREKIMLIYIDDIIILAQTEEEAIERLKRVLEVAAEYGLEFNFPKCQFLTSKIEFLGYIIENGTTKPSENKTLAVKKFPEPKNVKQIHSFLGLTSYFRKYIHNYATIAKPLSDLLRDDNKFKFEDAEKQAFETLKQKLTNPPVLHIFKRGAKTELHTDASSLGFGSVLLQENDEGSLHPIHYMSRKTTPTQSKYSSYELETLAIIESLKKFRNYLLGTKFKIVTDCIAFQKTLDKKDLSPKVARWALFLQEFDYEIIHRAGTKMRHVDALSRNTVLVVNSSHEELIAKIKIAQETDEHIQTILKLIDKDKKSEYFTKNEILYKHENDRELLVIPKNMQTEIIREVHKQGHYAVEKTEAILRENYDIPHLKKQIESVILNCVQCILCNKKRGKGEGFLNPISKQNIPLQTYHVDHIGPMPSTHKDYKYIFTVVDAFTKFTWLYPVKTTSSKEVVDKLTLQHHVFGNPNRIISDRGTAFTSQEFATYCQGQGIEHLTITTGIPRGNGQVERIHRTLIPILSKLSIEDPTKWYKHVNSVQRIMNSTTSRSTNFTPFELLTGVKLRQITDQNIKQMLEEEHINIIMSEREKSRDIAKENILRIQEENKRSYNRKRKKACVYKVNDLVAIQKTQAGPGAKLKIKFFGPYLVTKVKKHDRYEVKKIGQHEGPAITSSAADHMKKWTNT